MLLVFTSKSREGEVVGIDRQRLTIGRVAENDVQLADEKVSRHHAVIEQQDGGRVMLRDLGSRNGTFVNGLRLSGSYVLSGGELLRFGDQQLRVEDPARPQPPAAVTPPDATRLDAQVAGAKRRPRARVRRRYLVVAIALTFAVVVFGVGQLVLPGIAEQRVRAELARHGTIREVQITAVPAVTLLWHRADTVKVAIDTYRSAPSSGHGSLADFLNRTRDTGKLDVSVATLQSKLLTLHDVRLRKEDQQLVGQAELTQHDLRAALPTFLDLRPVSASANGIVAQASVSVLGHRVTVRLDVVADAGRVVVRPEAFLLGSLATITVFGDPRIYVESLGAELRGERYLLTARARLN
jgi:pSer/pThr/pTyr-binding forkhead associated (FHA) protein